MIGIPRIANDLSLDERVFKVIALGETAIPYLLSALDNQENFNSFDVSVRALGLIGEPAVPGLIEKLKSRNQVTRLYAARVLVGIGEDAIPLIRQVYLGCNNIQKLKLLKILGSIASPMAQDILASALQSENKEIRTFAASALARLGFLGIKTLVTSLEDMKTMDYADFRIIQIFRSGRPSANYLIELIQDKKLSYSVRHNMALLLGKLVDLTSLQNLYQHTDDLEIKQLALIATENYPGKEKIWLLKEGINFKTSITEAGTSVSEQALISLANSAFSYANYISPMTIDEQSIDQIAKFSNSNIKDARKAAFDLLAYLRTRYSMYKLKVLFLHSNLSFVIRMEILFSFVIFWIRRGFDELGLKYDPLKISGAYLELYQKMDFFKRR